MRNISVVVVLNEIALIFEALDFYLAVIVFLPLVSEDRANDIARVLDHHLSSVNVFPAEQTSAVYGWSASDTQDANDGIHSLMK